MLPDAECLRITYEILNDLKLGSFTIKVFQTENLFFILILFSYS